VAPLREGFVGCLDARGLVFCMDPIGVHHFWGFSPALDIQQLYRTVFGASSAECDDAATPLNILLLSPGDPRSIIKTIAQRFRHSSRPLHVRVCTPFPRARAR